MEDLELQKGSWEMTGAVGSVEGGLARGVHTLHMLNFFALQTEIDERWLGIKFQCVQLRDAILLVLPGKGDQNGMVKFT